MPREGKKMVNTTVIYFKSQFYTFQRAVFEESRFHPYVFFLVILNNVLQLPEGGDFEAIHC